ncbi:MAG: XamI family restriction endonuclease [Chloroflexi bacterium]|nr:XamI family restriction endonuclease [Chloroflexota bacterium]MCL5273639.1 XamI family restriction endonuclease [Chloroflexota bacterium]
MAVNADKTHLWKEDIRLSVDYYNRWFLHSAPEAYRVTRSKTTQQVQAVFKITSNLTNIRHEILLQNPSILPILRMATVPPLARDRLIGLAGVTPALVKRMEIDQSLPPRMDLGMLKANLLKICAVIEELLDRDICIWLDSNVEPGTAEVERAATIIADRLCGSVADPIIRNAQEKRQLAILKDWLEKRGYVYLNHDTGISIKTMQPGTFSFRVSVPVQLSTGDRKVNIPVDVVVMPFGAKKGKLPLLIEAKSAGDYTNTNKRRKEEAIKIYQLRETYGDDIRFILFLCGYFDSGYLGYEAAEGIDWVWEHRVDDLASFGVAQ